MTSLKTPMKKLKMKRTHSVTSQIDKVFFSEATLLKQPPIRMSDSHLTINTQIQVIKVTRRVGKVILFSEACHM